MHKYFQQIFPPNIFLEKAAEQAWAKGKSQSRTLSDLSCQNIFEILPSPNVAFAFVSNITIFEFVQNNAIMSCDLGKFIKNLLCLPVALKFEIFINYFFKKNIE